MKTRHVKLKAYAAALLAAGAVGCGEPDNDPGTLGSTANTTTAVAAVTAAPSRTLSPDTRFYIPPPNSGAVQQSLAEVKGRDLLDAARIAAMEFTPRAVWFNGGTPAQVQASVKKTVTGTLGTVPVLVAYNIPFRDCAQYSAGGAVDTASYEAWIDGFAAGIGKTKVVVILEPDSLGIVPYYTSYFASAPDWCQPTVVDSSGNVTAAPGANPSERFAQLNYAINSIHAKAPSALVYLDGTHSAWLGANEAANRLLQGGIAQAEGFFLNASNYQPTADSVNYGTWISSCLALINGYVSGGQTWWDASWGCPNQYVETPVGSGNYIPNYSAANVVTVNAEYASDLAPGWIGPWTPTTHFVVDTSRNGHGPLDASPYANPPYNQPASVIAGLNSGNWCNPPSAGLGARPTANTGVPLFDAELWVKTPGESDGSCDIAGGARAWDFTQYNPWNLTGAAQNNFDPLWGMVEPAAGAWFSQQALQLAQLAVPSLL